MAKKIQNEGVLLVEDSMIIAMDAEEMLRQIGFTNVIVAGSVDQAMSELDNGLPRFAVLDFNLGDNTSEDIARRLKSEGIPFWFATGYGKGVAQIADSGAGGVLAKPYTKQDLERMVASIDQVTHTAA